MNLFRVSVVSRAPVKTDCLYGKDFRDEDYERRPTLLRSLGLPTENVRLLPVVEQTVFFQEKKSQKSSANRTKSEANW